MKLNRKEQLVLSFLQNDIPLKKHPFRALAKKLECSEDKIIEIITNLKKKTFIRRIGAILFHTNVGYSYNAMVAWKCNEEMYDEIGIQMSKHKNISHCYRRSCPDEFPYPLFTMIHATDASHFETILKELKLISNNSKCIILRSKKEWKKTSMKYRFEEE